MKQPPKRRIIVIAHNWRSCHNVGSLLRTAEGLGIDQVILSGYTPYPAMPEDAGQQIDDRLPHSAAKLNRQITKTALGAEKLVRWTHQPDLKPVLLGLQTDGWQLAAVEQVPDSTALPDYKPPDKVVLVAGREVEGIEPEILAVCDIKLEIPMFGRKESFNVVQAAAMAMYHCRFA